LITKVPKVTILKAHVKEKMKNTLDIPASVLGDAVYVWEVVPNRWANEEATVSQTCDKYVFSKWSISTKSAPLRLKKRILTNNHTNFVAVSQHSAMSQHTKIFFCEPRVGRKQ
jgi:hypothetical protein